MEETKKYELTDETREICGAKNGVVYRIRATRDFGDVKAGELGGWVESAANLAQEGDCWIFGNAVVCDKARVEGRGVVSENAFVYGSARVREEGTVGGSARVLDDAVVDECAKVFGEAVVAGGSRVCGQALVGGRAHVVGSAQIGGCARVNSANDVLSIAPLIYLISGITFFRQDDGAIGVGLKDSFVDLEYVEKHLPTYFPTYKHREARVAFRLAKVYFGVDCMFRLESAFRAIRYRIKRGLLEGDWGK